MGWPAELRCLAAGPREKERADAAAGPQAGETGQDWAKRMRRERGRLGWANWLLGQIGERSVFSIFPFFSYFIFKTKFKHKPKKIQIWFKIHFLIQIKMRNFGMLP